jgi:hypothetical protein
MMMLITRTTLTGVMNVARGAQLKIDEPSHEGEIISINAMGAKASPEFADELRFAPLANLKGRATSASATALVAHFAGAYPGKLGFGNPGPLVGSMTRFRATPTLLKISEDHGVLVSEAQLARFWPLNFQSLRWCARANNATMSLLLSFLAV